MTRVAQTDGNKAAPKSKGGKKNPDAIVDSANETHQKTVNKDEGFTEKKKRRCRPGTVALRQIRKQQKSVEFLLQKSPFSRLVREILEEEKSKDGEPWNEDLRVERGCLGTLQESSEDDIVHFFRKSIRASIHGKRVTLMDRDLRLISILLEGENTYEGKRKPIV